MKTRAYFNVLSRIDSSDLTEEQKAKARNKLAEDEADISLFKNKQTLYSAQEYGEAIYLWAKTEKSFADCIETALNISNDQKQFSQAMRSRAADQPIISTENLEDIDFEQVSIERWDPESQTMKTIMAENINMEAEDNGDEDLTVLILSEGDAIYSPFTGQGGPDIYATYISNVYGCVATGKLFKVQYDAASS